MFAKACLVDYDVDGDLDLIVGLADGTVAVRETQSDGSTAFSTFDLFGEAISNWHVNISSNYFFDDDGNAGGGGLLARGSFFKAVVVPLAVTGIVSAAFGGLIPVLPFVANGDAAVTSKPQLVTSCTAQCDESCADWPDYGLASIINSCEASCALVCENGVTVSQCQSSSSSSSYSCGYTVCSEIECDSSSSSCATYTVTMSDSRGDGWSGTILYIGDYTFSLASGSSGTESICLEAGTYTPYACGGTSIDEVSWSVGLVSGDVDCSGSSTFVVGVAAAANDDYRCIISGFFALFSGCIFICYMY